MPGPSAGRRRSCCGAWPRDLGALGRCAADGSGYRAPAARIDALAAAGRWIFAGERSGCHAFLAAGDTLVVPELARYGRFRQDLIPPADELRRRKIGVTSLHERLGATTPGGRLGCHVVAALAEFIRELIVSGLPRGPGRCPRPRHGRRPPHRGQGRHRPGRPRHAARRKHVVTSIAKLLGVSPGTRYDRLRRSARTQREPHPAQFEAGAW